MYQKINNALNDVNELIYGSKFKLVYSENYQEGEYEGSYREKTKVFDIGLEDDYFLKVVTRTDSYGDNEAIYSIQIVKEVSRTVTNFEAV